MTRWRKRIGPEGMEGVLKATVEAALSAGAVKATAMLDVSIQAYIMQLIRGLAVERGVGILAITHNAQLARVACDEVFTLADGKVGPGRVGEGCLNARIP